MKNTLLYYFDINIDEIRKINDDYYFEHQNNNFVAMQYFRNPDEAKEIYELNKYMQEYLYTYKIIITKNNSILFQYNNNLYVLMIIPNIKNRIININDIINEKVIEKTYIKLDKTNWNLIWENKIDYIENQFKEIQGKYKMVNESINYFIGIWENAIIYFQNSDKSSKKCISHYRLSVNTSILEYLNPLYIVIDYKERDLGEYLKSYVLSNNFSYNTLNTIFNNINLSKNEVILLISRILFPSYYFDSYENIILNKIKEENIEENIIKRTNINKLILFLLEKYKEYNLPIINWIYKDLN